MEEVKKINDLDERSFLRKYYHDIQSVEEIGLKWEDLVELHNTYKTNYYPHLDSIARAEYLKLKDIDNAYITKYRIKDPEHLVDKVIRKKIDNNEIITKDSFFDRFDDLVGFRILHLFKDNWETIDRYIQSNYELNEKPKAYHRKGDSEEYLKRCEELGIDLKEKAAGYRSIHYVIRVPFLTMTVTCEVQVRTMIEDAWGEIDHIVRYPNNTNNDLLNKYLLLFNAFAGSADEMGTYLMKLKQSVMQMQTESNAKQEELKNTIAELKGEVSKLQNLNQAQRSKIDELMSRIDKGTRIWGSPITTPAIELAGDWVKQMQNPSGMTTSDIALGGVPTLDDVLERMKTPAPSSVLGVDFPFSMPKTIGDEKWWIKNIGKPKE